MATINAGRVRPYYRGAWASGTTYSYFDLVTSGGNSYLCINTSGAPAGTAVTNTTYWALIAQKGATGATGATGPQGPSGVYTGPLKPTADYWNAYSYTGNSTVNFSLPSGGTWAWHLTQSEKLTAGVSAGGTRLVTNSAGINILYWRIQ